MNYSLRSDLMPVQLFTVSGITGGVSDGIDLSIPAKIQIDSSAVESSAPYNFGFFQAAMFCKKKFTDIALDTMLGSGTSTDLLTRLFYRKLNLPNWVRVAAIIKFEMNEATAIEVRPVTAEERVASARAIAELKKLPNSVATGEKIRRLVNRFKQFPALNEADLFPFVIPIYPVRVEGQKALSYRVFAVLVGWNEKLNSWKEETSFEVITTSAPTGNNFIVKTKFKVDADGMPVSSVEVENRWIKAAKRAAELM